ncbi:MAG: hypothetical protein SNJ59_03285 [Aggregatilineales bacterium]
MMAERIVSKMQALARWNAFGAAVVLLLLFGALAADAGLRRPHLAYAPLLLSALLTLSAWYWAQKSRVLRGHKSPITLRVLRAIYLSGLLAILAYPGLIGIHLLTSREPLLPRDFAASALIYLLAILLFIQMFLVKLFRSSDDQRARERRRQVTARLMREFIRLERRAERGEGR